MILFLANISIFTPTYAAKIEPLGTVNVSALRSDRSPICAENQFFFFGCHPIGTLSIPNPTAGCGHNGLACANVLCPDGYTMPSSNCELTITIPSFNTPCYPGSTFQNGLCVPNSTLTSNLPGPVKLIWNGVPAPGHFYISVKYSNNGTLGTDLINADVGRYISQGIPFEDDWTTYCLKTYPEPVVISGDVVDYQCSKPSHCPNGTNFQSNQCVGLVALSAILPPLKQFKSGISLKDIVCKDNRQLVVKKDGTPVCLKPSTAQKLLERQWGLFSANIQNSKKNIWFEYHPAACQQTPWNKWAEGKFHGAWPAESLILKDYFSWEYGVTILDAKTVYNEMAVQPFSCKSPFANGYYLVVSESDSDKMIKLDYKIFTAHLPTRAVPVP